MKTKKNIAISKRSSTEMLMIIMERKKINQFKIEKKKKQKEIRNVWNKNNIDIKVLEERIELVKIKIEFIKGILKEYYSNLLKQGTDIRY